MQSLSTVIAKKISKTKEGYRTPSQKINWLVGIIRYILIALAIAAIVDTAQVQKFGPLVLVGLLLACYLPVVGDYVAVAAIVYWLAAIRPQSILIGDLTAIKTKAGYY